MSWSSYVELVQRLDTLRRADLEQNARRRQEVESARGSLNRLVDRLTSQQADLADAATALRIRMPLIDPPASAATSLDEALQGAEAAVDVCDEAREFALQRARQPRFLPQASPVTRNAAVYGACAGVALVCQLILILLGERVDTVSAALWSMFGLPALAFFVGYLAIGVVGMPRIAPGSTTPRMRRGYRIGRRRVTADPARSPRLGLAICFLALPVAWLVIGTW